MVLPTKYLYVCTLPKINTRYVTKLAAYPENMIERKNMASIVFVASIFQK